MKVVLESHEGIETAHDDLPDTGFGQAHAGGNILDRHSVKMLVSPDNTANQIPELMWRKIKR
ncbi:MAG TPA: hypothetical protein VFS88_04485, partial [Micavibrio sp.]|nr:hypothetical protein [Micavibrio sp.]